MIKDFKLQEGEEETPETPAEETPAEETPTEGNNNNREEDIEQPV